MKLSAAQQLISADQNRFRVVSAGRRFGKSWLSINEMCKFARFPLNRVIYIAPTYRQAKDVIWDELKSQLSQRNWLKKANDSELKLTLINNSRLFVRSSDNFDSLRGGKYNFMVMDEVADINPAAWREVLRPALSDLKGHALFIGTPKGLGNWFYTLWDQARTQSDWAAFQFTTLEGGRVDAEEISAARRDLDERTFRQEYEAKFVNYAGVIFYSYSEKNLVPHPGVKPDELIHVGIDFNTSPITAACATRTERGVHFFDEIVIYGSNTNELCTEIRNRFGNRIILVYPDASGGRRQTSSNGISDHVILHNHGFKVVVESINPPVADSIASVNSLLCNSEGTRNLLVDPKCTRIRESLIKYSYKDGTRIPDKVSGFDHMADCIRYITHKLFPLRPQMPSSGRSFRHAGVMLR